MKYLVSQISRIAGNEDPCSNYLHFWALQHAVLHYGFSPAPGPHKQWSTANLTDEVSEKERLCRELQM